MAEIAASREGEIREIRVGVGDIVRKNQEMMSIESPQLTTLILAAESGVVERLSVKVGDWVKAGQTLACIEKLSYER